MAFRVLIAGGRSFADSRARRLGKRKLRFPRRGALVPPRLALAKKPAVHDSVKMGSLRISR
jgi:hypothetical protein